MRSNDLVPLLSGSKDKGAGIRQGKVVYWNPDDATNVVNVGGTDLSNLPVLNTSEASLLQAGNIVSLITWGASYAILGRMVFPGTPEAVSSIQAITNRIQAAEDITAGTRNSMIYGDLTGTNVGPAVTIRIGASGRALVLWSAEIGQVTNAGNVQQGYRITPHVGVEVSGANTIAANVWNALNYNLDFPASGTGAALAAFWGQAGTLHLFTGLTAGDTTFTLKYRHDGILPSSGATSSFQAREIAVFAL